MICRGLLIQKHHLTYELGLVTKGTLLYKDTNWLIYREKTLFVF